MNISLWLKYHEDKIKILYLHDNWWSSIGEGLSSSHCCVYDHRSLALIIVIIFKIRFPSHKRERETHLTQSPYKWPSANAFIIEYMRHALECISPEVTINYVVSTWIFSSRTKGTKRLLCAWKLTFNCPLMCTSVNNDAKWECNGKLCALVSDVWCCSCDKIWDNDVGDVMSSDKWSWQKIKRFLSSRENKTLGILINWKVTLEGWIDFINILDNRAGIIFY